MAIYFFPRKTALFESVGMSLPLHATFSSVFCCLLGHSFYRSISLIITIQVHLCFTIAREVKHYSTSSSSRFDDQLCVTLHGAGRPFLQATWYVPFHPSTSPSLLIATMPPFLPFISLTRIMKRPLDATDDNAPPLSREVDGRAIALLEVKLLFFLLFAAPLLIGSRSASSLLSLSNAYVGPPRTDAAKRPLVIQHFTFSTIRDIPGAPRSVGRWTSGSTYYR